MGQYINEIKATTLLSENEIYNLILACRSGNLKARDLLIEHNLRIVLDIAFKYAKSIKEPVEDLLWIGVEGLLKAIYSYDSNKKTKFSSYAFNCISNHYNNYYKYLKYSKRNDDNVVSLQTTIVKSDRENDIQLQSALRNDDESVEDQVIKKIEFEELLDKLQLLSPRERDILLLRYGVYNGKCYSLNEIAKLYNVSHQRISQKQQSAIKKLRKIYEVEAYKKL